MKSVTRKMILSLLLAFAALVLNVTPVFANCDGWAQDGSEHRNAGNGCTYRCSGSSWSGPVRCDGQGNGQFQGSAATTAEQRAAQARAVEQRNREAETKVAEQGTAATAAIAASTAEQRSREATRQQAMVEAQRQVDVDVATRLGASAAEIAAIDARAREAAAFVAQAQGTDRGQNVVGSGAQNAAEIASVGYDAAGELGTGTVNVSAGTITGGISRLTATGGGSESVAESSVYTGPGSCVIIEGGDNVSPGGPCCRGGKVECADSGVCLAPGIGYPGVCSGAAGTVGPNTALTPDQVQSNCSLAACGRSQCQNLTGTALTQFESCVSLGGDVPSGVGTARANECRRDACGSTTCLLTGAALSTYNNCMRPFITDDLQKSCSRQVCNADVCTGITAAQTTRFNNCLITGSATAPSSQVVGPSTSGVGTDVVTSCRRDACDGATTCLLTGDKLAAFNRCVGQASSDTLRTSCGNQLGCPNGACSGLSQSDVARFNACLITGTAPGVAQTERRWKINGVSCAECSTARDGSACSYTSLVSCQAAIVTRNAQSSVTNTGTVGPQSTDANLAFVSSPTQCAADQRGCTLNGRWTCVSRAEYPEGPAYSGDMSNGCILWSNDRAGRGNTNSAFCATKENGTTDTSRAGGSQSGYKCCNGNSVSASTTCAPASTEAATTISTVAQATANTYCAAANRNDGAYVGLIGGRNYNLRCCNGSAIPADGFSCSDEPAPQRVEMASTQGLDSAAIARCHETACGNAMCNPNQSQMAAFNRCVEREKGAAEDTTSETTAQVTAAPFEQCTSPHGTFTGRGDQNKYCCNGRYSPVACTEPINIVLSEANNAIEYGSELILARDTFCGTVQDRSECSHCRNGETYNRGNNLYCSLNQSEVESQVAQNLSACCIVRFAEDGRSSETNGLKTANECNYPDYRGICTGRMLTRATSINNAPYCSTLRISECLRIGQQCRASEDGGTCFGTTLRTCSSSAVPEGTSNSQECRDAGSGNSRFECPSNTTKTQNTAGVITCAYVANVTNANISNYVQANCPGATPIFENGTYRCPGDIISVGGSCSSPHGQRINGTLDMYCCSGRAKEGQCAAAAPYYILAQSNLPDGTWCTPGNFGSCTKCLSGTSFVENDRHYCGTAETTRITPALDPNTCSRSQLLQGQSCCTGYAEHRVYEGLTVCQRTATGQAADTVASGAELVSSLFGNIESCGDRATVARGSGNSTPCSSGLGTSLRSYCNAGYSVYNGQCVSSAYFESNSNPYCKVRLDGTNNAQEEQLTGTAAENCLNNGQCGYPSYRGICSGRYVSEMSVSGSHCRVSVVNTCTSLGKVCSPNENGGTCVSTTQPVTMPDVIRLGSGEKCEIPSGSTQVRCQCVQEPRVYFIDNGSSCPGVVQETTVTPTDVPYVPGECSMTSNRENAEQCGQSAQGNTLYRCTYGRGESDPANGRWVCPDRNGVYPFSVTPEVQEATAVQTGYVCGNFRRNCASILQNLCYACGEDGQPTCQGLVESSVRAGFTLVESVETSCPSNSSSQSTVSQTQASVISSTRDPGFCRSRGNDSYTYNGETYNCCNSQEIPAGQTCIAPQVVEPINSCAANSCVAPAVVPDSVLTDSNQRWGCLESQSTGFSSTRVFCRACDGANQAQCSSFTGVEFFDNAAAINARYPNVSPQYSL